MRLTLFILLLSALSAPSYSARWGHLKEFEKYQNKFITQWIAEGKPIKYCIEVKDSNIEKTVLPIYVEEGIKTWLNNEVVKACGVYDKKGKLIDLSNVKITQVKEPCDTSAGYLIIYFDKKGELSYYDDTAHKSPVIYILEPPYISASEILKGKTDNITSARNAYTILVHELGHAMGVCDQYTDQNCGWLYRSSSFPKHSTMSDFFGYDITHDDAIGLLTIFDRLSGTERVYLEQSSTISQNTSKVAVKMTDSSTYNDRDLYIKCKDGRYTPLLKGSLEEADLRFPRDLSLKWLKSYSEGTTEQFIKSERFNINEKGSFGTTPLMLASSNNKIDDVRLLLDKGVKIDEKDNTEETALMYAARSGSIDVVKLLITKGAKINEKDVDEKTVLMYAAESQKKDAAEFLLSKGAKLDEKDIVGTTALMFAARSGCIDVVKLLIDKGAKLDEKDSSGKTALMYAKGYGRKEIETLLRSKGAKD